MQAKNSEYFVIARSKLNSGKLFVEFYLPKYQTLFEKLRQGKYPLLPLSQLSKRLFDGSFGSNRKVEMYQESGIPYIRVKDVLPGGIDDSELAYISEEKHTELIRSRVVSGNVLLTIAGRVGTAAVFPDSLKEGNITGHIAGIELLESINPHYLATFLNSPLGEFQCTLLGHRTTRPELNLDEVGQILVPVPPRLVQDRIAQVMQDAYTARQNNLHISKKLLDEIDNYVLRQLKINLRMVLDKKHFLVAVSRLIGGRFDVESVANEFDTRNHPHIAWIPLHELAELPSTTKIASRNPELEYSYLGMSDVDNLHGEVYIQRLLGKDIKANKIVIRGDDVVFARIEPCVYNRKIALIPSEVEEALGSTELLVTRAKYNVSPIFLLWILRSELIQQQIAGKMTGTTGRRRLPNSVFANLQLPKASLELQEMIAEEATRRRDEAKRLRTEAETLVAEAKVRVERMILGEEELD